MKQKVDNFDLIIPHLRFKSGSFFTVNLLFRNKDGTTLLGSNKDKERTFATYPIYELNDLNNKRKDIINACEALKCRANISINLRTDKGVNDRLLKSATESAISGIYKNAFQLNSIIHTPDKRDNYFLIDIDNIKDEQSLNFIKYKLFNIKPIKNKILYTIPTYSGFHCVSEVFDREEFDNIFNKNEVSYHVNGMAALYYPEQE